MTDEEIKAIEILKYMVEHINCYKINKNGKHQVEFEKGSKMYQSIEIVLKLIQKQKEEIEKKDKQIDLMAEEILYENNCSGKLDFEIYKDKEEVIKDFEKKVEE